MRRTELLVFLTPHVIRGPQDLEEVYQVKRAQREVFQQRFGALDEPEQREELTRWLGLPAGG